MGKNRLTVRDNGFKRLMALGKSLAGRPHVKVGFLAETAARHEAPGEPADLTNVELAIILHFGTTDIPPRKFFTNAVSRRRRAWRLALGKMGRAYMQTGNGLAAALAALGARAVENVKTAMRTVGVPDAASTLRAKDGTRPLIDSKQLLESVTFQVVMG